MVDTIELQANETVWIDTQANIVAVINLCQKLEIFDQDNNKILDMGWGEVYTLGYNKGKFLLKNDANAVGRIYIFRQFIL